MWHTGRPAAEQCEGCTFNTTHINELSYLNSRDVSYATFSEGPSEESSRYRDFMGYTVPGRDHDVFGYFAALEQWYLDGGVNPIASYVDEGMQPLRKIWSTPRGLTR